MDFQKLFIDGAYIPSTSAEFIEVINPVTEERIGRVPKANKEDLDKAVKAAGTAFDSYKKMDLVDRIEIMENFLAFLIQHRREVVDLIVEELGSPRFFTEKVHFDYYMEEVRKSIDIVRSYSFEREEDETMIVKEPVGVVGALTPWNYPLGQILQKIVFALLVGNTVILKPSRQTPLVAYYVAEGLKQAGLPKGVFNLLTGVGSDLGLALAMHPGVDLVSFTGSTKAGVEVGQGAMLGVKRVTLELGGKSPAIFLDRENMVEGIRSTLSSVMYNSGQTCSAWTRAIVLRELKDDFEKELVRQFGRFSVGLPEEEGIRVGPLVSVKQREKVLAYIEEGKKTARVLVEHKQTLPDKGYFVHPIIFADVDNRSALAQDEIFGPVLAIIYVDNEEEAVRVANDSIYGLSGAVFGARERALAVAREIRTGSITVNQASGRAGMPFGGYKMSGIGREGGVEGLEEFLETKVISIQK